MCSLAERGILSLTIVPSLSHSLLGERGSDWNPKNFVTDCATECNAPMLVNVPQRIETPQIAGLVRISTSVRLKKLHEGECFLGKSVSGASDLQLCVKGILSDDG